MFASLFLLFWQGTAFAQAEIRNEAVSLRLLSAVTATGQLKSLPLGLQAELQEGWKIYWRSPGDAGLPPELSIKEGQNKTRNAPLSLDMRFPVPERFSLLGLDSYGYSDEVIFPVFVSGHKPGMPVDLTFFVDALVCSDICVPVAGELDIFLPAGSAEASLHARDIARFSAFVPGPLSGPDIQLENLYLEQDQSALFVDLQLNALQLSDIFVETEINGLGFAAPERISDSQWKIAVSGTADIALLEGKKATLTVKAGDQFIEKQLQILPYPAERQKIAERYDSLFLILLTAFAGGLILNIMPCVLPVLSLKLASVIQLGGQSQQLVRTRLLVGAAGIITSFLILGGGLVLMKWSGARLGWGIQFQNQWFLVFMITMMSVFTLSLLDIFKLPVPHFATKLHTHGLAGDFASGFMATILATPCSAPLVGTAVSFALAAPSSQLMLVMMFMGLGLASPWLLVALFPQMISVLPAPGRWLKAVRPILSIGLFATLIWLCWLLAGASGQAAMFSLILSLILSAAMLWRLPSQWALKAAIIVWIAGIASFNGLAEKPGPLPVGKAYQDGPVWQGWTKEKLEILRQQRQPVFVDVTADWCITCQVNKALVLNDTEIITALKDAKIVLLQADWTHPNREIDAYLASFGRFGIPFNLLYLPDEDNPVIFDELLSKEKILKALDKLNR